MGKLTTAARVSDLTARVSDCERGERASKKNLKFWHRTLLVLGVNKDGNQLDFLSNLWAVRSVFTGQEV